MNVFRLSGLALVASFLFAVPSRAQQQEDPLLQSIFRQHPEWFDTLLQHADQWGIQVIYTEINRDRKGNPRFNDHFYHVDPQHYYYPASTVKFPIACLALQRLHELDRKGLTRNTTMVTGTDGDEETGVDNDPTAVDGRPTIEQYIRKILLVSDNDAFNRLYEFLGQDYINQQLHAMGYTNAEILHRLSISLSEQQNRHTNPVSFYDTSCNLVYAQPAAHSNWQYAPRQNLLGNGYMQGGKLVKAPFDFSAKNRLDLQSLHRMIRSVIFPKSVSRRERFKLDDDDLHLLRLYMSMRPGESVSPSYPEPEYYDNYVKTIYYGTERVPADTNIRIFGKTGTAYGFLIDASYFVDFANGVEFMVSAIISCNSDGVYNDDHYDYTTVGYPFMKHLGRALYAYELQRPKKNKPNLDSFRFQYTPAK